MLSPRREFSSPACMGNAVQLTIDVVNAGKDFVDLTNNSSPAQQQQTITDLGNTFGQYVIVDSPFAFLEPVQKLPSPEIPQVGLPSPGQVITTTFIAIATILGKGANAVIGAAFNTEAAIQQGAFNLAYPNIVVQPTTVQSTTTTSPAANSVTNATATLNNVRKRPIVALVERGGEVRATHMNTVNAKNVRDFVVRNASRKSRLHTDCDALLRCGAGHALPGRDERRPANPARRCGSRERYCAPRPDGGVSRWARYRDCR
jgi:hypothetical protein